MEELYHVLSSSARLDKRKRRKRGEENPVSEELSSGFVESKKKAKEEDDDEDDDSSTDVSLHSKSRSKSKAKGETKERSLEKQRQIEREEMAAFRRRMHIRVNGGFGGAATDNVPPVISSFDAIDQPSWWSNDSKDNKDSKDKRQCKNLFSQLKSSILRNVEAGSWTEPMPIQMQCIPSLLARRDVVGAAPTGSGKSAAFILPALLLSSAPSWFQQTQHTQQNQEGHIRALLLAPSRELAAQLHRELNRLAGTASGWPIRGGLRSALLNKNNTNELIAGNLGGKRGLDILVSTPMRLCSCLNRANQHHNAPRLHLSSVRLVVLDEADRLLDATDGGHETTSPQQQQQPTSGSAHAKTFVQQVDQILTACPSTAIRALFSATMGTHVRSLSESILRDPVDVTIGTPTTPTAAASSTTTGIFAAGGGCVNSDITQKLLFVGREEGKLLAIRQLIQRGFHPPAIIFLQSKERASALFAELMYDGVNVDVIHAGKSQSVRDASVARFRRGETWILICTDLVARGVDFRAVNMVINYDVPSSGVAYVHRIGRTGRAGRKGTAITLFTESDFESLRSIAHVMKLSGCEDVPEWMLAMKKMTSKEKKKRIRVNPKRKRIDTSDWFEKKQKQKKKLKQKQKKKEDDDAKPEAKSEVKHGTKKRHKTDS